MEKEPSQRQLRVGQEIKRIIAGLIERDEVRNLDAFFGILTTITEVRISPDLKYSNVYFITSQSDKDEEVRKALQLAAGHFRKQVASKTDLRYVPELFFRIDDSFEKVGEIEQLLRDPKVAKDLEA